MVPTAPRTKSTVYSPSTLPFHCSPHPFFSPPKPGESHAGPRLSLGGWCLPPTSHTFPTDHGSHPWSWRAVVKVRWQLLHPTFDLQPLLVVFLLILIRRLEDTWAAGHGQLLGVHIVLHLAWRAADERGPLPGTWGDSSGGAGRARWGILAQKERHPCSRSETHISPSSLLTRRRECIK